MRWIASVILFALTASTAMGQIEMLDQADPYQLVSAKLSRALPEKAYVVDGGWTIVNLADPKLVASTHECKLLEIWWVAPPGKYSVSFDGVIVRDVTFTDANGQVVTLPVYVGKAKGSKTCEIKGGSPPSPPPPPVGKYNLVLFYSRSQLDNLPETQRDILNSLVFRKWIRDQGHVLLEVVDPAAFGSGSVPEKWKPWIESVRNDPLPRIGLAPKEGGGHIADYDLPASVDACKALIGSSTAWEATHR